MRLAVPASELSGKILLVHTVFISGNGIILHIDYKIMPGHRTAPCLLHAVIPRIPVHLIAAQRRSDRHRQADPIWLRLILDSIKGPLDILRCYGVLRLKILMENADFLIRVIFFLKIQRQI